MQKYAVVVETENEIATVEVSRKSACEGCASRDGCHACIALSDNRAMRATAQNQIGAGVGDRVVVETESATVIGYAAAVFLLPLALGIIGYLLGGLLGEGLVRYIAAIVGFAVAFGFLYFVLDRRAAERHDVRIVRIIEGDSAKPDNVNQC